MRPLGFFIKLRNNIMEYELNEQDIIDHNFYWLTLHTYDLWSKGKSLDYIRTRINKGATKDHEVGSDYYNHVNKYISNTYELLCNINENEKCINSTKVLAFNLALILAKKVANEKEHATLLKLMTRFKELIRIGSSLEVFNDFVEVDCVKHNMDYFEHLLVGEINRFEKKSTANKGASIKDTLNLLSAIDIALKCKIAQHTKKRNTLVFIGVIVLAFLGVYIK
jgi:hypothetical protein